MNDRISKTFLQNSALRILVILTASVVLTTGIDLLLPSSLPLKLSEGMRPGISKGVRNDLRYTDVNIAWDELIKGNCILVDVRDKSDFSKLHPVGAFNVPYHESEEIYSAFSEKVSVDKKIYILCDGSLCSMSIRVASQLSELGYRNTIIIKQDFKDWNRLKLPTESGSDDSNNNNTRK